MLFARSPIGLTPLLRVDAARAAVESDFSFLKNHPNLERHLLVIAYPVDAAGDPIADYAAQWSDHETHLEEPFRFRVETAIDYESSILSPDLAAGGIGRPAVGEIRITRDPVDTAPYWSWIWDGRPFEVKVGLPGAHLGVDGWALSQYETVIDGLIRDVRIDKGHLTLLVLDHGLSLRDPLQQAIYAGTGGLEGGDDLKGSRKPYLFGSAMNVSPRLVDPPTNTYQVHDRRVASLLPRDGGRPFTAANGGANDITDLALASILDWAPTSPGQDGQFITDLSQGLGRTSTRASKAITFDVVGDADAALGGYVDTTADLIERILRQRAGYVDGDFNLNAFGQMNLDQPGAKGFYSASGDGSIESVISALLLPMGWAQFDRVGRFGVGTLKVSAPSGSLTVERVRSVRLVEAPPPVHRVALGYAKSWTVQADDALLDAVTDAQRAFAAEEYRVSADEDAAVDTLHENSRELEIDTLYVNAADADAERARLLALLSRDGLMAEVVVEGMALRIQPGQTWRVYWPDLGLDSGVSLVALSVAENSSTRETRLLMWG